MADYSLALGVKPLQLEDPLTAYGRFATIQNAQNQNALAQYQLSAAQREDAATNALNAAYKDAYNTETGDIDLNKLRKSLSTGGFGAKLPALEKSFSELKTQKLTQSKTETELIDSKLKQSRSFLDTIDPNDPNAPQQYIAWHKANHKDPVLGPLLASRGVTEEQARARIEQAIKQGPQAFAQLLMQSKLGVEEFTKQNAPKFFSQDTGGQTQVISIPGLGGPAATVAGSTATKTLTPGEAKPTVSQVDVGDRVLTQSYDPVTGKIIVLETRPKGLTPGEAKPTVSQVDVGDRVLTQSYDPVTGKITVLETRPKGLTPGEAKPTVSQVDTGNEIITQSYDPVTKRVTVLERKPKQLTPEQSRASKQEASVVANTITDEAGNVRLLNKFGQSVGEPMPGAGKPSASFTKLRDQRAQLGRDLGAAINELTDITKDGGLIDQSTGSGVGRLVDVGKGFFGGATPGAIATAKLKPIQDLVLKTIPRFEGPQSDKDTQSYKEAAGQLADPNMPTAIRKEAAKTVLRLMTARKNQFVTPEMAAEGAGASGGGVKFLGFE
jgi:hypothetical protein